jgi:8-oxo-dGTP diphosphatase
MSLKVAVAVICNKKQQILITQRPSHAAHGGMWEFPGGKLEEGELPTTALIREIKEEVSLDIIEYSYLGNVVHDYGSKTVDLSIFFVENYKGLAYCRESQTDLRWVSVVQLKDYQFPEANKKIIALVRRRFGYCEEVLST